jgi:hypothetical protein
MSFGLKAPPLILLDMDIGLAAKNSKMGERWFGTKPGFIGGDVLE